VVNCRHCGNQTFLLRAECRVVGALVMCSVCKRNATPEQIERIRRTIQVVAYNMYHSPKMVTAGRLYALWL